MAMTKLAIFCLFLMAALVLTNCAYTKKELVQTPCVLDSIVSYQVKVAPIIQKNCFTCHSSASNISGILLETHDELKFYADNGYLYGTISHSAGYNAMPNGGAKLSDCDIAIIQKWIDTGAKDN
jgi:uncharacterized membrane protein